jgi:hypothetical protein
MRLMDSACKGFASNEPWENCLALRANLTNEATACSLMSVNTALLPITASNPPVKKLLDLHGYARLRPNGNTSDTLAQSLE